MSHIFKVFLLTAFAFCASCSTPEKRSASALQNGKCEEAFSQIKNEDLGAQMITRIQQAGGTLISYAFTGASYTAEVLVDVGGGTVMVVALCGPTVALMAASRTGASNARPVCLPGKIDALSAPPLGKRAYKFSQSLRCPNLDPMSRSLRKVAACFESRNTPDDLKRAETTLQSIHDSGDFYGCLTAPEQAAVDGDLEAMRAHTAQADFGE